VGIFALTRKQQTEPHTEFVVGLVELRVFKNLLANDLRRR
jgi:hypothetical protein